MTSPNSSAATVDRRSKKRRRVWRWFRRLLVVAVLLFLGLLATAWFARDALLVWAQNKALDQLDQAGVHVTLGAPRWVEGGGFELSDLQLHPDAERSTDLLRLGRVRVQPDYLQLMRKRSLDAVLTSRENSLWVKGMDENDRVGLDNVELIYREGELHLAKGNIGVSGVQVLASGRIPTAERKPDPTETKEERKKRLAREDERDLEVIFEEVGTILAQVIEWTRLHAEDDAVAPVVTLLLDEPSGGVSARLEGQRFEWQGLTWDRVLLEGQWHGDLVEITALQLAAADAEVSLRGRYQLKNQVIEIDEWRISGNPLGPLVAYSGNSSRAIGWEVVRPVVIEGRDLRVPMEDLDQVGGTVQVVEPGELRWTHTEMVADQTATVLTLNEWRLQAALADGKLNITELGLAGEFTGAMDRVMPVKLEAVGAWQIDAELVTIPEWLIEGDLLALTAALLPNLTQSLAAWSLLEPVTVEGSDWQLPLTDIKAAEGRVFSPDPLRARWQPGFTDAENADSGGVELTLPELRFALNDGRLEVKDIEGWIQASDSVDQRVEVTLSAGLPLGGGVLNVGHLALVGDLPGLLAGLMPRLAPDMASLGWSGEGAGLQLRNAHVPLTDLPAFRAEVSTTAAVDFVWRLDNGEQLTFTAVELAGEWLDQELKVNRIEADWLGGRLNGKVSIPLSEGFDGLTGQLGWTDSHGALEVPFVWSVSENRLMLSDETRSRADLLALWTATPWGQGSLPDGLKFSQPPGLRLEKPLLIRFDAAPATEVDLRVDDPGGLLVPTTDGRQLEIGVQKMHAHLRAGSWSINDLDALVAGGELTATAASLDDGLWQVDATWSDGDVSRLLDSFGLERSEATGSRGTLTFGGVVGGSLTAVNGGGRLEITEARLVNIIILREIYQLIAVVLPIFQTPQIGTVTVDYEMKDGVLTLENGIARSDTVVVRASGDVDFNQEELEIQARANLHGVAGLATAIASRALEIEVAGGFDDYQVRLRNAAAFQGMPEFVLDSSRIVIQSGYKAPIKVLEIGADGGMRVLSEGARVIEGGVNLLEQGVRAPGGIIRRLPFLGRERDEEEVPAE